MILGNPQRFAIEYELNEDPDGRWMNGRSCYWICGRRVGDWDSETTLRDFMYCLETISRDAGHREHDEFMSLSQSDLLALFTSVFRSDTFTDEATEERSIEEQWARFVISPEVGVFQDWQIYLIERNEIARLIYSNLERTDVHECRLDYGEFDVVVRAASEALEAQHEALVKQEILIDRLHK